ncbi:phage portal protein family protein [Janibacter sp. GS2]|uniref:phage portal protein family protein n=1 Tax=Janibacter sp. GS2 TaxID=3442646 RepID=UPI003EBADEAC
MKSQPAQREVGYAATPNSGAWWDVDLDQHESTPELRWPLNLPIYDAMVRQDAQVASVLRAVTLPIRSTTWRIEPNGAPDHVVEHIALDLGLPIRGREDMAPGRLRERFSWSEHLRHALLMLRYGHMYFEQIYRPGDDGLYHLRKLGPRMPRSIMKFNVARDGGLSSIEQYPDSTHAGEAGKGITLPVSRLVAYVHEREAGNWAGTSLLRTGYKNWLIKDRLLRTQAQAIDRNGMGIPVYEGAENGGTDDLEAGEKIARDLRSGDNSGAATPNTAKLRLMGVEGTVPDADKPIRYHDEQIARAVLAHFLNLGTQTGSWALGSTFADFFTQSLQAVGQDIADITTAHVIEDLVDLAYGPDVPAPRLVFDEIGSQTAALATAIKKLVDASVITPDEGLEAHLRLGLGLPTKTDDTASGEDAP